jgi:hypothetical protein
MGGFIWVLSHKLNYNPAMFSVLRSKVFFIFPLNVFGQVEVLFGDNNK